MKNFTQIDFSIIKNQQRYLLWGAGSFLMGGMLVYGWIALREIPLEQKQEFKSSLSTGASRANLQEAWVYRFSQEAEVTKKRLDTMENMLLRILKMISTAMVHEERQNPQKDSPASQASGTQNQISKDPVQLIESVREDLKTENQTSEPSKSDPEKNKASGGELPLPPGFSASQKNEITKGYSSVAQQTSVASSSPFRSKSVRKISLSLRNARYNASLKTVDNAVPAGAFAKAVLLGGVDASASIQASSDPRPALLRITDLGTLPRQFRSDLKGCHVLAACYGDISSERVFMRLEKLTCIERKTGEIIEVKVQGYVAGEDGRTGVRGSVVDRAGENMRAAMIGGFMGGIGEFLSQSRNAVTFSPVAGLARTNPMKMGDMLKHGSGKGVSNALDKYADFYIKRAEQVQPIIQVAAGRQVDIVFTEGLSIGDSLYRQAIGRSKDQGRYQQIQVAQEESQRPISDWAGSSQASVSGTDSSGTGLPGAESMGVFTPENQSRTNS